MHGWKLVGKPVPPETFRCVFVYAPHTSNWDFYYGVICMLAWGVPIKVAIKKFWTKFPFGLIVKPIGGVAIDRKRGAGRNQVELLAKIFDDYEKIALVITPEGSRSLRKEWKTGFYHIAQKAKVPIVTLSGDFKTRTVQFGPVFKGRQSLEEVMRQTMAFYKKEGGPKYPEKFSVDVRYG